MRASTIQFIILLSCGWLLCTQAACQTKAEKWPTQVNEIQITSSADQSKQPALFYAPTSTAPKPLLICLHSWSSHYQQLDNVPYAEWCIAQGWAFIHPNFRGPNVNPAATGSALVISDVLDALAYAKSHTQLDQKRIYLVGTSGGGHLALLLAGKQPELWAGVSAWVPISDLNAWHSESVAAKRKYAADIEASCGGNPVSNEQAAAECRQRSPLTFLANAKHVPLDINTGITDGHTGSVPISHSLLAFNQLASPGEQFTAPQIKFMVEQQKIPAEFGQAAPDETYGAKTVLLRRTAGQARLTIFQGGHEGIPPAGLQWLAKQRKP